jgi:hypothetical protein
MVASLIIAGKVYTIAEIVQILQARIDGTNAASAAKATYQNLVQADRRELAQTKLFVAGLRQAVYIMFSLAVDTLADFGINPHKTRKAPAVGAKVKAVAQAEATRAARHTLGKTQKAKIKGVVPETTPATPPAAPAAPPAPAGVAPAQAPANGSHASTGSTVPAGSPNGPTPPGPGAP